MCSRLLCLGLMVGRSVARVVLVLGGATTLTRVSTGSLSGTTDSLHTFGCSPCRTQCAFQVPLRTSGAWELLVAFRLRLRTITAGYRCATGGLGYYPLRGEPFFVVLVAAVYGVMSLQKVSEGLSAI